MSQSRLIEGVQVRADPPIDLHAFETRLLAMRSAAPNLGAAFAEAFSMAAGDVADAGSPNSLWRAGLALVAHIETNPGETTILPYHDVHHFAEATLAMGWLCATARDLSLISATDAALGVVAMVAHDLDHDGRSTMGGVLERHAAAETARISRTAGVRDEEIALLVYVIEGTDPAMQVENAARTAGTMAPGPFDARGDWLRSLANEADVFASLLPALGPRLGDALAAEMRMAGDPAADSTANFSGRLAFLRRFTSFTPAAASTGLPGLIERQIAGLVTAARCPDLAATPEQAAAALDRMELRAARAAWFAAIANLAEQPEPEINAEDRPPRLARRPHISLTVTILTAFSVVFITVMGFTALATYRETMRTALAAAARSMDDLTARTAARTEALVEPLYATLAIASVLPDLSAGNNETVSATETSFRGLLLVLPQARAVSAAGADGALLRMVDVRALTPDQRLAMAAPDGTRWAVRAGSPLSQGNGSDSWRFLDPTGRVLAQRVVTRGPDPREEVWFRTARESEGVTTTVLHMMPALGAPGVSIVRNLPGGGVLGIDVALDALGSFLAEQRISPRGSAFIIDDNGILIAHSDPSILLSQRSGGSADPRDVHWITIASSPDPILHGVWTNFATGLLAPGRDVTLDLNGQAYLARIAPLDRIGSPPDLVAVVAPVTDFTGPIERMRDWTAVLFLVAGGIGMALITFVARQITRPMAGLIHEADAIRRFELDAPMTVSSHISEVAALAATMAAMKSTVRTFSLYVPKDLVRQLVLGGHARLGGERRVLTVMFTDIVGFTSIGDRLDAERFMRLTTEYFESMTGTLMRAGGTIDKYIGDAVMALWNAPGEDALHAAHGCLAALRCHAMSAKLALDFARRGWPAMHTRFGVNTGEAVIGNVGSSDRMAYTAIGTTVNMASRLEGLNKFYGTHILVTETTRAAAGGDFVFRRIDRVLPKGRHIPTEIHELLGLRHAVEQEDAALVLSDADITWASAWDDIVAAFLERRFEDARALLPRVDAGRDDPVARLFEQRLAAFIATPPPADWDGVAEYHEK